MPGLFAIAIFLATAATAQPVQSDTWLTAERYETFHIVLPEDAPEDLQYAAEIFIRYWKICTRHEITASPVNEGVTNVWLGPAEITTDLLRPEELEDLGPEGYLLRTYTPSRRYRSLGAREQLIISGLTPRGTLNGVFAFFRNHLGVRWLVPGMVHAPMTGYRIRPIDETYRPHFAIRESGYFDVFAQDPEISKEDLLEYRRAHGFPDENAFKSDFSNHRLDFGRAQEPDAELPLEELKDAYKKLQDSADSRTPESTTSPPFDEDASAAFADFVVERIVSETASVRPVQLRNQKVVFSRPKDIFDYCPKKPDSISCMSNFLNAFENSFLVQENANEYAFGIGIDYGLINSRELPELSDGVYVHAICPDVELSRPYSDTSNMQVRAFFDSIQDWSQSARRVVLTGFVENLWRPGVPFPILPAIAQNLQDYDQMGVLGVRFLTSNSANWRLGLRPLQSYVIHNLMWDPDRILDELIEEFTVRFYGDNADAVQVAIARIRKEYGESCPVKAGAFRSRDTIEISCLDLEGILGHAPDDNGFIEIVDGGPLFDSGKITDRVVDLIGPLR